jgi:hypothetical protein
MAVSIAESAPLGARSGGAGALRMSAASCGIDGARNGGSPEISSNKRTPRAQMSARGSMSRGFSSCSGAMYGGEPRSALVAVAEGGAAASRAESDAGSASVSSSRPTFETPKSSTLTRGSPPRSSQRKRFAGLRSR